MLGILSLRSLLDFETETFIRHLGCSRLDLKGYNLEAVSIQRVFKKPLRLAGTRGGPLTG